MGWPNTVVYASCYVALRSCIASEKSQHLFRKLRMGCSQEQDHIDILDSVFHNHVTAERCPPCKVTCFSVLLTALEPAVYTVSITHPKSNISLFLQWQVRFKNCKMQQRPRANTDRVQQFLSSHHRIPRCWQKSTCHEREPPLRCSWCTHATVLLTQNSFREERSRCTAHQRCYY